MAHIALWVCFNFHFFSPSSCRIRGFSGLCKSLWFAISSASRRPLKLSRLLNVGLVRIRIRSELNPYDVAIVTSAVASLSISDTYVRVTMCYISTSLFISVTSQCVTGTSLCIVMFLCISVRTSCIIVIFLCVTVKSLFFTVASHLHFVSLVCPHHCYVFMDHYCASTYNIQLASQITLGQDSNGNPVLAAGNKEQDQLNMKWISANLQSWFAPGLGLKHPTCVKLHLIKITLPNTGFNTSVPFSSLLHYTQTNYRCFTTCSNDQDMACVLHQLNIINM